MSAPERLVRVDRVLCARMPADRPQQGHAVTDQANFPRELEGKRYYHPGDVGREKKIREYLDWFLQRREEMRQKSGRNGE